MLYSSNVGLRAMAIACLLSIPTLAAIHERSTAKNWKQVATPSDDTPITLRIGLREQNLDQLESLIYAVSTPGSSEYGKYMEDNQLKELLQPSELSEMAVTAWLQENGIERISSDGYWITFTSDVSTVNQLLETRFNYYEVNGVQKMRTNAYSVPDELYRFVDLIVPTTYFGLTTPMAPIQKQALKPRQSASDLAFLANSTCTKAVTPKCLHEMYNIPANYTPSANSQSKLAFSNFLNQSARASDLYMYEDAFSIPRQGFNVEFINGGTQTQEVDDINHQEANMDVQLLVGVAAGLNITSYNTGGHAPIVTDNLYNGTDLTSEAWLEYFQYLLSQPNSALPHVISHSYGDEEQTVPEAYARRVCNQIGQLGLRGISVLASSGDSGLGGSCEANTGDRAPRFTPIFPASCPYVTTVGGTQANYPEIGWNSSGGGFSDYFAQPKYQSAFVGDYLKNKVEPETLGYLSQFFNKDGRAYPDISAHSYYPAIATFENDQLLSNGGTSASAPIVAGIIGLLNDIRLSQGKPALGFLNPWLYSKGFEALGDIVEGQAGGCDGVNLQTNLTIEGAPIIPYAKWNATVGWDPLTGLGRPDFGRMREYVSAL